MHRQSLLLKFDAFLALESVEVAGGKDPTKDPEMDASFWSFLRAFTGSWLNAMSGGLGVPLLIIGILQPNARLGVGLGLTGIAALVFAAYRVWRLEREAVITLSPPRVRIREINGHRTADILDTDEFVVADGSGGAPIALNLPKSPKIGSRIEIKKGPNPNAASAVIVEGNGHKIDGQDRYFLSFSNQAIVLTFVGPVTGWQIS